MSALKSASEREWTTREQLILASAVQKSGDQNWVSVSRAMKPVLEVESVSADFFSHKNCALQYSSMLDKAGTHKRRRSSEGNTEAETAGQHIVRELVDQYLTELDQALAQSREEYQALKKEMEQIEKGELDAQLPSMWEGIQAELAMSKASSSSRRKSSPSKSSLNKQLDQMKQQQQRKKGSPASSPGSGLTRSLSSSGISSKKAVVVGEVSGGEGCGTADDDKSTSQVAALLGYGGSPAGSVGSSDSSDQLLSLVVGGDRIQSPRPSQQAGGHERALASPGTLTAGGMASPGTLTAGGVVFPTAGGGMIMPVSGITQEQGSMASDSLPLGVKIKAEPVSTPSPTPPMMLLPPPATKLPTPQLSFPKLPLDMRGIKKEPSSASPTTVDTPSPRVLTTPIKDEKMHVPMQTPPSTHVVQMPAEVHVIIQQPNIAALPVQEKMSTSPAAVTGSHAILTTCAAAVPLLTTVSSSSGFNTAVTSSATSAAAAGAAQGSLVTSTLTGILSSSTRVASSLPSSRPLPGVISGGSISSSAGILPAVLSGASSLASGAIASGTIHTLGSSLSASVKSSASPVLSSGAGSAILTAGGGTSLLASSYPVLSSVVGGSISAGAAGTSSVHPTTTQVAGTGPGSAIIGSLLASSPLDKSTSSTLSLSLASGSARTSGNARLTGPNLSSGAPTLIASSHSVTVSPVVSSAVLGGTTRVGAPVRLVEGSAIGSVAASSGTKGFPVTVATGTQLTTAVNTTLTKATPTSNVVITSTIGVSSGSGLSAVIATAPAMVSKLPHVGASRPSGVAVVAAGSVLRQTPLAIGGSITPSGIGGSHAGAVKTAVPAASKEGKALPVGMAITTGVPTQKSPDQQKSYVVPAGATQAPPSLVKTQPTAAKTSPVLVKTSPTFKAPPTQQARTQALPQVAMSVSPQSARLATPSSGSPASMVKSSPDASKSVSLHLHPTHHTPTAAKSSFLPSLSLSSSLVSIGGAPKSLPTSVLPQGIQPQGTLPQGAQPQSGKPQKAAMVHLEKKVISSKQHGSKSAVPDSSAAATPHSTSTTSVANVTSAVATVRATVSTASKPKLSTVTGISSSPSTSLTSSSSSSSSSTLSRSPVTTVVSSSLSIPILSPSKDLLTTTRQSVSHKAHGSSTASSTVSGSVASTVTETLSKEVPGSKRTQAHSEQKELVSTQSGAKMARDSQSPSASVSSTPASASPKGMSMKPEVKVSSEISDKQPHRRLSDERRNVKKGSDVDSKTDTSEGKAEDYTSPLVTMKVTPPTGSVEQETPASCDLDSSLQSRADSTRSQDEMDTLDDEAPLKTGTSKPSKSSMKKQWNTRSKKRRTPQQQSQRSFSQEEGYSMESTDTEDDSVSHPSAVPSPAPSQGDDSESVMAHRQWKKAIIIVWRHAAQHKYANLFLHPVRDEDAPGYSNVILRPMDLSTIKKKIDSGLIKTDIEFQRDMLLMFQNAFMYNNSQHEVYFMAQEMKNDVMENIQEYLATQAQLQLMEEATPSKTLRSREGRFKESYEEHMSPAKKRRTRADDI